MAHHVTVVSSKEDSSVSSAIQTSVLMDGLTALTPQFAVIDHDSSGDNEVVAAVTGKKIRVLSYSIIAGGTVMYRWESGASGTALTGQMQLEQYTGIEVSFSPVGHFETAAGQALNLELNSATTVDGHLVYVEV